MIGSEALREGNSFAYSFEGFPALPEDIQKQELFYPSSQHGDLFTETGNLRLAPRYAHFIRIFLVTNSLCRLHATSARYSQGGGK